MAFTLTGFTDEINKDFDIQMAGAKKYGLTHIEMRGIDGISVGEFDKEKIKPYKKKLDENGIKVSAIGSPMGKIRVNEDFDSHLVAFKNMLDVAQAVEAKYIRLFSFYPPEIGEDPTPYRDEVLRRMNEFVKAAKGTGVMLLHENEKNIYGDIADRCVDLVESIGSDNLRVIFDPANFVHCGEETFPSAFNKLKNYIEYMHIKDAKRDSGNYPSGQGEARVKDILQALKDMGYNGFLSLEPHLSRFEGLASLEQDVKYKNLSDDGERAFALALNSLKAILSELK